MAILFELGQHFDTWADFTDKKSKWEDANYVKLWSRDTRTVQASRKKFPNRVYSDAIQYGEAKFHCVHGGRQYKSQSTGKRPMQSTQQLNCPFQLKLKATSDGQELEIVQLINEHNHECNPILYQHLPGSRRLDSAEQSQVGEMLKMQANRKLIAQHFAEKTYITLTPHTNTNFPLTNLNCIQ